MKVWAIADLHIAFGIEGKEMDIFGPEWANHFDTIKDNWERLISPEDLVLLAGDLSWAKLLTEVIADLEWVDALPGTKVMIRGNHDYWWSSPKKIRSVLPPSIHIIQNDVFNWNGLSIGGARLWDTQEFSFGHIIDFKENKASKPDIPDVEKSEQIFQRELGRLELSLKKLDQEADKRIVMTHYPPLNTDLEPSKASALLEQYHTDICVFGHLHSVKKGTKQFGRARGVQYYLTSADYLGFTPLQIL